jgi:hypothetical protein
VTAIEAVKEMLNFAGKSISEKGEVVLNALSKNHP